MLNVPCFPLNPHTPFKITVPMQLLEQRIIDNVRNLNSLRETHTIHFQHHIPLMIVIHAILTLDISPGHVKSVPVEGLQEIEEEGDINAICVKCDSNDQVI